MSLVRLCIDGWQIDRTKSDQIKTIWPDFDPENAWKTLEPVLIDIEDIPEWAKDCSGLHIKPVKKVRFEKPVDFHLNPGSDATKEVLKTVNQIVFPGFELLQYGYIEVLDDACTDAIQRKLDDGFRIIAILPQPQQRRPDYVLVRKEKP